MKTILLPATDANIDEAGALIRRGEVVGFPTETVYGLGADARNGEAVAKIFAAKGRPGDNPLIVHIATMDEVAPLIEGTMPENARKLAEAYWPGPLTMIMRHSALIPPQVTAGLFTVGLRMPSHEAARKLIQASGAPIAAPSGNRSGRPSPTTAAHMVADMDGRIPMILDGGPCAVGVESTVLDVTVDPPRVLRPGGVTPDMIARVCGGVEVDGSVLRPLKEGEIARSPGMKYRHYAPRGCMTIVRGAHAAQMICALYDEAESQGETACVLAQDSHMARYGDRRARALGDDAQAAAANLFAALRDMDDMGISRIFSEAFEATGVGLAVMNRMGRAAAFDVIQAD